MKVLKRSIIREKMRDKSGISKQYNTNMFLFQKTDKYYRDIIRLARSSMCRNETKGPSPQLDLRSWILLFTAHRLMIKDATFSVQNMKIALIHSSSQTLNSDHVRTRCKITNVMTKKPLLDAKIM